MANRNGRSINEEAVIHESKMRAMAGNTPETRLIRSLLTIIEKMSRERSIEHRLAVDYGDRE